MKLVVGLGNPGKEYEGSRHNIGFKLVELLAGRYGDGHFRHKHNYDFCSVTIAQQPTLLMKPMTFMNLSGRAVQRACTFYRIERVDLLVVCDDFNLPAGKLRIRPKGSDGGQRGLRSVIQQLGTAEFSRLRIGIGPVPEGWDPTDFVLGKFSRQELRDLEPVLDRAEVAITVWIQSGVQECMNSFN